MRTIRTKRYEPAFTVAELITAVIVASILVLLALVGISSWRTHVARAEVKNDIVSFQASMEDMRNNTDSFPIFSAGTTFLRTGIAKDMFIQSKNVEVTYIEGDATYYCVNFQSLVVDSVLMHLDTTNGNSAAEEGPC